jgi:hypothetical protein
MRGVQERDIRAPVTQQCRAVSGTAEDDLHGRHEHLGVARRQEAVPLRLEFGAQLAEVVDLAAEGHDSEDLGGRPRC